MRYKLIGDVQYDGGVCKRSARRSMDNPWLSGILFGVPAENVEFILKVPSTNSTGFGIARRDADPGEIFTPGTPAACFFHMRKKGQFWSIHYCAGNWCGPTKCNEVEGLPHLSSGDVICMKLETGQERQIVFIIKGQRVVADKFLPEDGTHYVPFLILGPATRVEVRATVSLKRPSGTSDSCHGKRMWADRQFTDAVIETGTGTIDVHRSILCCSPYFKAVFTGQFRESKACHLRIEDSSHESVEAFVQFLYTGDLPDEVNNLEVLKLAHRYENHELLVICANACVSAVTGENVCEVIRTLRPFKDDTCIISFWQELSSKLEQIHELREALMLSL